MKNQLRFALLLVAIAATAIAQTNQRQRGPLGEKIREARQKRAENKGEGKTETNATPHNNGSYVVGKNRFTTVVNGDTREYFVHVPKSYNKAAAVPVVFMLHGHGQTGEQFYNISGWKEVGETENLITVFPSSWRQCTIEEGKQQNTLRWSSHHGVGFTFCPGVTPRDDIKFLSQVIDELGGKFTVNQKMIYMVGFSNGGQMTARVGLEMSDRVAAVVSSGGFLKAGDVYTPKRLLPNLVQVGTHDDKYIKTFGGSPAPMNFDQLFAQSQAMKAVLRTYQKTYQLDPNYITGGDPNKVIWLDAKGTSGDPNNVFRFALIKNMLHVYPNGKNFPLNGAKLNWQWLKQYKLS